MKLNQWTQHLQALSHAWEIPASSQNINALLFQFQRIATQHQWALADQLKSIQPLSTS